MGSCGCRRPGEIACIHLYVLLQPSCRDFNLYHLRKINPTCIFTRRQTPILSEKYSIQKLVQKGCRTGSESSGYQAEPLDVLSRSDSKRRFKRIILWDFSFVKMTRSRFYGHQKQHQKRQVLMEVFFVCGEQECAPKLTKWQQCTTQS